MCTWSQDAQRLIGVNRIATHERSTSPRDAIDHLAAEAERLRCLAAISDVA
jgi:hypothetical protein